MAAADLDGNGSIEIVVTTTNTATTGAQVFVFNASGGLYRPGGAPPTAWPRYNAVRPDLQRDRQPRLRRLRRERRDRQPRRRPAARDRRHVRQPPDQRLQPRRHVGAGLALVHEPRERTRGSAARLGAVHPLAEPARRGPPLPPPRRPWPDVRRTPWLQWTASPPSVADLDRDGRNEVIGLPNVERGIPYRTQSYAFMVLDGAQRGGARSARRHRGFGTPPLSRRPAFRPDGDWYPPSGIPAPTVVNIVGDRRPEIVAAVPDGSVYAVSPRGASCGATTTPADARRRSPPRSWPPT